ncbi:F-box protein [Cardamine amara subsp. amara]|uniref:F-box protein n=1 Tax=Cardamine amara subsp. amara TaxID=228776 RepID=A0ABD1BTN4_CARAN
MPFEMNQDMIIDVLSRCPASVVDKFRIILNKECYKRTYNSSFIKLNLQRTNSVSGYFLQYMRRYNQFSAFVEVLGNRTCESEISLDFLPPGRVKIEACDASHGILLCINDRPVRGRGPLFIICKPTTKQYLIIPNPKTRYFAVKYGLMVIGSNPFRYKILRLSNLPSVEKRRRYNFNNNYFVCEVFDSDSFAWKRINNVEVPEDDLLSSMWRHWHSLPIASYGVLHWLTLNNNVFGFCLKTETWLLIPVPENVASASFLTLSSYEGKLAIISLRSRDGMDYDEVWVLKSYFDNSWVSVKKIKKNEGLEPVWLSGNDAVTLADWNMMSIYTKLYNRDRIFLYNLNNGKSHKSETRDPRFFPLFSDVSYFPFYSDYERVEFDGRSNGSRQVTL